MMHALLLALGGSVAVPTSSPLVVTAPVRAEQSAQVTELVNKGRALLVARKPVEALAAFSEADALGVDAARLHVAGHSAGGHLAAYMAADPLAPPLASAHILSGVVDLEALFHIPMGRVLGLHNIEEARALSPIHRRPRAGTRIAVAVGGDESDEFKRQSAEIAGAWGAPAPLVVAGANHFSLLDDLIDGKLLTQAKGLCEG